jgi:type IV secretory pathway ATPase VirB11/archaellum biosynthesis ATPase
VLRGLIQSFLQKKENNRKRTTLLIELFEREKALDDGIFSRRIETKGGNNIYRIFLCLKDNELELAKKAVSAVSNTLDPDAVKPLTFERLVEVVRLEVSRFFGAIHQTERLRVLSELTAYECIGLSRFYAISTDNMVTEFFCDSELTPLYLDHLKYGRCDTEIILTKRERDAIETHLDTFGGYSLDFRTPSLKHDLEVSGKRLRVSLDLEPLAVNRFSLDVRRLDLSGLTMQQLISLGTLTKEAASFIVAWAELGGNVSIMGETGTGKTTLMNAIDRELNPKLRRIYIEDAVETADLLENGYHQLKLRVEPYDKQRNVRTKEFESVKILHRSPDIMILGEIQSEEHSKALFSSLEAGVRGLQTFHCGSLEQALRRWVLFHGISESSLLDLGLLVQMSRPNRLGPKRIVSRVAQVLDQNGKTFLNDIFLINEEGRLEQKRKESISPPPGRTIKEFLEKVREKIERYSNMDDEE